MLDASSHCFTSTKQEDYVSVANNCPRVPITYLTCSWLQAYAFSLQRLQKETPLVRPESFRLPVPRLHKRVTESFRNLTAICVTMSASSDIPNTR